MKAMINRNFWNSVFTKSVLIFILIIIPLYGLSAFIYNWGINTVKDGIISTTQSQVNYYLNDLDAEIQRIQDQQISFMTDTYLNELSVFYNTYSEIEKVELELLIQQRLNSIKSSSSYIGAVDIYIQPIDLTISTTSIMHGMSDNLKSAYSAGSLSFGLNLWGGRPVLAAQYPYVSTNASNPAIFTVFTELSSGELEKALVKLDDDNKSASFLINENQGLFISQYPADETLKEMVINQARSSANGYFTVVIANQSFLVIYAASAELNIILAKCISESALFGKLNTYRAMFWMLTLMAFIIAFIYSNILYRNIHKPMKKIIWALHKVEAGDFKIRIDHSRHDEFQYLYERFNTMTESLGELIDQTYRQKILVQNSELKQLQSQINPHFLFNSFFTLKKMAMNGEIELIEDFAEQLGDYFQFITRNTADETPLPREVEHARVYAEIQARRFSNRIHVVFEALPGKFEDVIVPRLIIQPLLENAFEHGLKNKLKDGLLKLEFVEAGNDLSVIVEDNGAELKDSDIEELRQKIYSINELTEITGIINIHRRLLIKYGIGGISISRSDMGGLKAVIHIPLEGIVHEQNINSR